MKKQLSYASTCVVIVLALLGCGRQEWDGRLTAADDVKGLADVGSSWGIELLGAGRHVGCLVTEGCAHVDRDEGCRVTTYVALQIALRVSVTPGYSRAEVREQLTGPARDRTAWQRFESSRAWPAGTRTPGRRGLTGLGRRRRVPGKPEAAWRECVERCGMPTRCGKPHGPVQASVVACAWHRCVSH